MKASLTLDQAQAIVATNDKANSKARIALAQAKAIIKAEADKPQIKPMSAQEQQEAQAAKWKKDNPKKAAKIEQVAASHELPIDVLFYSAAGYSKLGENKAAMGAYTTASFMFAGYLTKQLKATKKGGNAAILKQLCKSRMIKYWVSKGYLSKDETNLTKDGLQIIADRLAGKAKANNHNMDLVNECHDAMKSGGKASINGFTIPFYPINK